LARAGARDSGVVIARIRLATQSGAAARRASWRDADGRAGTACTGVPSIRGGEVSRDAMPWRAGCGTASR
jgi:hypothetical protein